jgi:hypothetical protein
MEYKEFDWIRVAHDILQGGGGVYENDNNF